MITKIRLQNWKSFKDSTIYIDSLGILIGTNASGKSNVLDAFAFLRAVGDGKSLLDAIQTVRGGEDWNPDQPVDARGMSDGTLRFIAIVVALLTAAPHSLLLIEEVDNGLHPSRAKELVDMLKELSRKRQVDVLCTTHNPVLLDELGNKMIPFVSYVTRDEYEDLIKMHEVYHTELDGNGYLDNLMLEVNRLPHSKQEKGA